MIQQRFGPGASNTLIYNRGSHIKFAQLTQAAPDTQIDAAAAFSKYYVEFNRASITPTSTLLRPRRIPTGVEQFKGSPGPFNVTASWTMDASAHRMELPFRQLLNAPTNGITTTDGSTNTETAILPVTALAARGGAINTGFSTSFPSARTHNSAGSGPVQVKVTLSHATGVSAVNPVIVGVLGTDVLNNRVYNELTFTSLTNIITPSYFQNVECVISVSEPRGGRVKLDGTSKRSEVLIESKIDYRQTPGLTFEIVEGSADSAGRGATTSTISKGYLNTFGMNFTKDQLVAFDFGIVGKDWLYGLSPTKTGTPIPLSRAAANGPYSSGASEHDFTPIQDGVTPFGGAGVGLYAEDPDNAAAIKLFPPLETFNITFDNGTNFTNRTGSLFPGIPYNTQRTINVEMTCELHSDNKDMMQAYLDARVWKDIRVVLTRLSGGNEEVEFRFPRIEWDEYPGRNIEGNEYGMKTFRGTALPSRDTITDAMKVFLRYDFVDVNERDAAPEGTQAPTAANLALGTYTA